LENKFANSSSENSKYFSKVLIQFLISSIL